MSYNLNNGHNKENNRLGPLLALRKFLQIMADEKRSLIIAMITILVHSSLTLAAPYIIGYTIDHYIKTRQYEGVLLCAGILLGIYMITMVTSYLQTKSMGGVGQRVLFKLRNRIFDKLQQLPVAFFHENKAGDLISRINNDTDKLSQFFSQSLIQFIGSLFIMTGAAIFILAINFKLGAAALVPSVFLLLFSRLITPWVKKLNATSMTSTGNLSAEIQESLANFKVVVAYNRRDYFRERFMQVNRENFKSSLNAGLANNIFMPLYGFFSNAGQLIVLAFGIFLISKGEFTVGFLISFLSYINNFYMPLRQLAALWSNFQITLAGWDRISVILNLKTDMELADNSSTGNEAIAVTFNDVSFSYGSGKEVLHKATFELEKGKTYAFVGPTGGGKTTTASLISRLYDPTKGTVLLGGKDLKSIPPDERSRRIGFILQDPFIFTGTVRENVIYGNPDLENAGLQKIAEIIHENGLSELLSKFTDGLDTRISGSDSISLGQKQIIAFVRAVLRKPEILILDEATANIDTVTEQQLESILHKLPSTTTKIIIAHRLNTIENADEIFFVNSSDIIRAGSMKNAVSLLMKQETGVN